MAAIKVDSILFTPGRACGAPSAVVLHEYSSGVEALDAQMRVCPRRRPAQSPGCHTSYHYGIGGACNFHQYVAQGDTAWGFGITQPTCPTPPCPPTPCESCTGEDADQYNSALDGTPPTPDVTVGADLTVNCSVIHVAITGVPPFQSDLDCCHFWEDPQTYNCVLRSLCEIFTEAGLTPDMSTLLVHCGELMCLDLEKLITDLEAFDCTVTPVSPCINCPPGPTGPQGPAGIVAGVNDTDTIDMVLNGANEVQGNVKLALVNPYTNFITAQAGTTSGIFAAAVDSFSISLTGNATTGLVQADLIVDPVACNLLQVTELGGVKVCLIADSCASLPNLRTGLVANRVLGANSDTGAAEWKTTNIRVGSVTSPANIGGGSIYDQYNVLLLNDATDEGTTLVAPANSCTPTDFYIKNIGAQPARVVSADLIDGQATHTLAQWEFIHVVWSPVGTTWYII